MSKHEKDDELKELDHKAVPGYKPVFYTVFVVAGLYLGFLLYNYL